MDIFNLVAGIASIVSLIIALWAGKTVYEFKTSMIKINDINRHSTSQKLSAKNNSDTSVTQAGGNYESNR